MPALDWKKIGWALGIIAAVVLVIAVIALISRGKGGDAPPAQQGTFGSGAPEEGGGTTAIVRTAPPLISAQDGGSSDAPMVFKIADGPIAAATFVQTYHPTTTVARYLSARDGHMFDLIIDSAGAIPQPLSNITIPGITSAMWAATSTVVGQYLSGTTVKTLTILVSAATSSDARVSLRFLPDNLSGIAVSPDGSSLAYLKRTDAGSTAYVAKKDGTGEKTLFTLPFRDVVLSWPSPLTLLAYTKSHAGAPGAVFAAHAQTGAVSTLFYGTGVTATANPSFSHVLYQLNGGSGAIAFAEAQKTGASVAADPLLYPEKCTWSRIASTTAYCSAPADAQSADYLDLWHAGLASAPDALYMFNAGTGVATAIALPARGVAADIISIALSPDERYLSFITKGDRTLWGVRLR